MSTLATEADLTARARVRNAAIDLYGRYSEDRISLRAVAAEAGVTSGVVQHHFKTKGGLRDAADQYVIELFVRTLASVPTAGTPAEVAAARDAATRNMLRQHPEVARYARRAIFEADDDRTHITDLLVEAARNEITNLRAEGFVSTRRDEDEQALGLLMRQLGELVLGGVLDRVWERIAGPGAPERPQAVMRLADG
jgi:AcrR family transcriptional regulator